ncbi:Origin of replication complex subunit 5 [Galdieria sulphuraria]|nr:Origin of replication complex subunit 5 [Galdieria sulphuraria]
MSEQDYEVLQKAFPCRTTQIRDVFVLYKATVLPLLPLYLYGLPSTGKKTVISLCLEALNKRKVEIDCFLCPNERALYESILNRLSNHIPSKANGYQSWKKTERLADFIRHLNEIPCKEPTYLILLHADTLVSICPKALIVLLELEKYSTFRWIHVTLTAYLPWERLKGQLLSFHNVTTPYLIWFPNYQWNECAMILENMLQTDPKYEKLKKPFVRTVLDVLYHAIPYLDQLLTIFILHPFMTQVNCIVIFCLI